MPKENNAKGMICLEDPISKKTYLFTVVHVSYVFTGMDG
jgi:hypothetical protein